MFQKACEFFKEGHDLDLTLNLIRAINKSICNPPLDDDELARIVKSASKYEPPGLDTLAGC